MPASNAGNGGHRLGISPLFNDHVVVEHPRGPEGRARSPTEPQGSTRSTRSSQKATRLLTRQSRRLTGCTRSAEAEPV